MTTRSFNISRLLRLLRLLLALLIALPCLPTRAESHHSLFEILDPGTETPLSVPVPAENRHAGTETASSVPAPAENHLAGTETASSVPDPAENHLAGTETASSVPAPAENRHAGTETASSVPAPAKNRLAGTETASSVPAKEKQPQRSALELAAGALYGHNPTFGHYGGVDLGAFARFSKHFEAQAALEAHNPGVFALTAVARPVIPVGFCEFFADATVHSGFFTKYKITDLALALDAGVRMNYLEGRFGLMSHAFFDNARDRAAGDENIFEPVNMLYFIQFSARSNASIWNISVGGGNFNDYEYERSWEPMYFIHGRYDFSKKLRLTLRFDFKPAGAFHLNAQYCGVAVRSGVTYRF